MNPVFGRAGERTLVKGRVSSNGHDPAGVAPKDENWSYGYTRMDTDVF